MSALLPRLRHCYSISRPHALRHAFFLTPVQKRTQHDGFASLNIYKDAAAAPKEMPDNEYPDWLWHLQDPEPTKEELLRVVEGEYEKGGYDAVFDNVNEASLKRLFRLHQKQIIKDENARRKGGNVV